MINQVLLDCGDPKTLFDVAHTFCVSFGPQKLFILFIAILFGLSFLIYR